MGGNSRGARLECKLDLAQYDIRAAALGDQYDLTSRIANLVNDQSHKRFETQIDPDGQPWVEWSEAYRKTVTNPKAEILKRSGELQKSIASDVFAPNAAVVGTKRSYAKIHQYGGISTEGYRIPARPYLGVSDEQQIEIDRAVARHLQDAAAGRL